LNFHAKNDETNADKTNSCAGNVPVGKGSGASVLKIEVSEALGFACAKLTIPASAFTIKKGGEMKAAVRRVFFFTGNPRLMLGCFMGKSVFVKVY
jgi:hypothetical protein